MNLHRGDVALASGILIREIRGSPRPSGKREFPPTLSTATARVGKTPNAWH